MNTKKLPIITVIICILVVPFLVVSIIGAQIQELAFLNPTYQNATPAYRVSDTAVLSIKLILLYGIAPLSIALAIAALINLRLKRRNFAKYILLALSTMVACSVIMFWLIDPRPQFTSDGATSNEDGSLRLRQINLQ